MTAPYQDEGPAGWRWPFTELLGAMSGGGRAVETGLAQIVATTCRRRQSPAGSTRRGADGREGFPPRAEVEVRRRSRAMDGWRRCACPRRRSTSGRLRRRRMPAADRRVVGVIQRMRPGQAAADAALPKRWRKPRRGLHQTAARLASKSTPGGPNRRRPSPAAGGAGPRAPGENLRLQVPLFGRVSPLEDVAWLSTARRHRLAVPVRRHFWRSTSTTCYDVVVRRQLLWAVVDGIRVSVVRRSGVAASSGNVRARRSELA